MADGHPCRSPGPGIPPAGDDRRTLLTPEFPHAALISAGRSRVLPAPQVPPVLLELSAHVSGYGIMVAK
ncbi:hypothetical protein [Streptomyces fungicidicus]|uniref:hypothetical protein n=1 Tax=Streptomyces fungicidicus TaxID=68203 RepID=UPI00369A3A24